MNSKNTDNTAGGIKADLGKLIAHNKGALLATNYADYTHANMNKSFKCNGDIHLYAEVSEIFTVGSKCQVCKKMPPQMQECPCGKAFYCSKECQRKEWPIHRLKSFHIIKQ